mmetsp:Transcript_7181/g.21358  ORF Transcript_7181/g.21358 Transcript_7181/m.21358 type:complete len:88 (-) Transcript_7181:34-297(-)
MGNLAKATATLEGNVQASLNRKKRLMGALGTSGIDDQGSVALPNPDRQVCCGNTSFYGQSCKSDCDLGGQCSGEPQQKEETHGCFGN